MKKYIFILSAGIISLISSCSDFLDRKPYDTFTDYDYWTNEANVKAFAWGLYYVFSGYGNGETAGDAYRGQLLNDDQARAQGIPLFDVTPPATSTPWTAAWDYVRKANILLSRTPQVNMPDESKKHYMGVARFARAELYFDLMQNYGDLPWHGTVLDPKDPNVFGPRLSRVIITDSILADLNYAIENLRVNGDGTNTINKDVALALKSRICLFEGTYRKYRNMEKAGDLLKECKSASEALISSGKYSVIADYSKVFNSINLSGNKEMIMYKEYVYGVLGHNVMGYVIDGPQHGLTKNAVESYLCTNGLPIKASGSSYAGDDYVYNAIKLRDKRLRQSIDTAVLIPTGAGIYSSTGYKVVKYVNKETAGTPQAKSPYNETDAPVYRYSETLLNYAEACVELSLMGQHTLTQSDLDKSINLLRPRADLPALQVIGGNPAVNGTVYDDPDRDADVPSLLWEVRRERRAEMMMDGLRFWDVVRWKKGSYLSTASNPDAFLGAKIPNLTSYPTSVQNQVKLDANKYILPFGVSPSRPWDDKYYLRPIPTNAISRNQNLEQNPGW